MYQGQNSDFFRWDSQKVRNFFVLGKLGLRHYLLLIVILKVQWWYFGSIMQFRLFEIASDRKRTHYITSPLVRSFVDFLFFLEMKTLILAFCHCFNGGWSSFFLKVWTPPTCDECFSKYYDRLSSSKLIFLIISSVIAKTNSEAKELSRKA